MKCQYIYIMEFYVIIPENASFILDKLGFGESKCAETSNEDGRYGRIVKDGIEYGFRNMHAKAYFGDYVVDDAEEGWIIMSEKSFFDSYELVEE